MDARMIGKWFGHLTVFFFAVLISIFSDELFVALLKARALITCLIANLLNELLLIE
jgi:hypothetical protein